MKDKTISRRVARYRRKLKHERDMMRVEVLVPTARARDVKLFAAKLRALQPGAKDAGTSVLDVLAPFFHEMARRYFWWKKPEELAASPIRVALQVMDIGAYEDVQRLVRLVGNDFLRDALKSAEPGQLNPRSWTYWPYRPALTRPGQVPPPPPVRTFA